jgi:hypothetical protein
VPIVNAEQEVLAPVRVEEAAYMPLKQAARLCAGVAAHMCFSRNARLFSQLALETAADDQILFARMAGLPEAAPEAVAAALDIPTLPSFLPYLLRRRLKNPVRCSRMHSSFDAIPM